MQSDAIWQAFARTGDPVYYLLYKTVEEDKSGQKKNKTENKGKTSGNSPRL